VRRREAHPIAWLIAAMALLLVARSAAATAEAADLAAAYRATWAGLPAGEIRLGFHQSGADYRDEIAIVAKGLPRWLTRFRADAVAVGRLAAAGAVMPSRYAARYDLRKRRDSRIDLRFVAHGDDVIAERGAGDSSHKPMLAEAFRRNALDPISALAAVRHALQANRTDRRFVMSVFDGARRFDVIAHVVAAAPEDHLIRVTLSLHPIAGFKGESSEDGDPDSAPRPVEVAFTDDADLLPVSLRVSIAYLPLVVRLDHRCDRFAACANDK